MPGTELKAWRESVGFTQEKLAEILGVSREWVGKLETGDRPISANIYLRVEALKREQKLSIHEAPDHVDSIVMAAMVHEDQAPSGTGADIEREVRRDFDTVVRTAQGVPERLHWIAVQLKEHLATPKSWRQSPRGIVDQVRLPSQTATPRPTPSQAAQSA